MVCFLGTGLMLEGLKQEGTSHSSRDLLKIWVKMQQLVSASFQAERGNTIRLPLCVGVRCEWLVSKPIDKDVEILSQSGSHHSMEGWSPVANNGVQAPQNCCWVISSDAAFWLLAVVSFS
ncbi:hypothetical protein XENOCAPTIV_025501 [Xenoophorus captivus]|uniref:Uncharacterized protein n=1 Tax=Xenoophorus captivus TaxID=1517983 RepID=A0ABV0Q656_9TELE